MRGFAINQRQPRPAADLLARFVGLPTAVVSDNMHRLFGGGAGLRPLRPGSSLCAPAFTVRVRPGDNLMVHKALDIAEPGDVVVVDAGGDVSNAIIGEIMWRYAERRSLAGFVIDGAVRDTGVLSGDGLPVFARGITHRGPYKDGPGEIGYPVAIGGMVVNSGDIVLGDDDGLLVVPLDAAGAIAALASAQQEREAATLVSIANGTIDRTWIDRTLAERGATPNGRQTGADNRGDYKN
jgi:regulator of RNase E activity RraA